MPRESARLACQNRPKMLASCSGGMPGPVSEISKAIRPSSGRTVIVMRPPFGVNLIAFPTRFESTWSSRAESADTHGMSEGASYSSDSDAALANATRLGQTGEIRRLLAKGRTLLDGREWTDTLDYATSLVLRTDRIIIDPARPYVVRLEQLHTPSITLPADRDVITFAVAPNNRAASVWKSATSYTKRACLRRAAPRITGSAMSALA